MADEELPEDERELPDLPPSPDSTTAQVPLPRVCQKTQVIPGEYVNNPIPGETQDRGRQ